MKIKPEMESFIRNNYLTMSYKKIAQEFGCDVTAADVQYWLTKQGLHKGKEIYSQSDIDFIKNNYQTMTYLEMSKVLGFTEKQIRGKARSLGIRKTRLFNNRYFANIDTPIKAYFLGFIFADGWIVRNPRIRNYEFGMQLQRGDKYILERLNQELDGVHAITYERPSSRVIKGHLSRSSGSYVLRVYSKPLVEDLYNHGIDTNKSYSDVFPIVPDNLFWDFLRGYIDGDGCYYLDRESNIYMHITCPSLCPIEYIQNKLLGYNIKTQIYPQGEWKNRLMCTNAESMKLLVDHLYYEDGLFCLQRKYDKIKPLLHGSSMQQCVV